MDELTSKSKANDIMKKLHSGAGKIDCPLVEAINKPKQIKTRKLLTGNVVEELANPVEIVISTTCPKKWVLVDLETGDQYSSLGMNPATKRQSFVKPIRRVVIPKPLKKKEK